MKALFFALIFLMASVSAESVYVGYSNQDYRFELYYNDSYHYVATPYSYIVNDYYYFDYPFRVYTEGTYYYFERGWYGFGAWGIDDYWTFAPDVYGYYDYYGPNYYYDDYWTFAPDWVSTYAPNYYGVYYYPPVVYSNAPYGYEYYERGKPTLTGQHHRPERVAECSELSIDFRNISMGNGDSEEYTAFIHNYSVRDFDLQSASVYIDGFGYDVRNVRFDDEVKAKGMGKIRFEIDSRGTESAEMTISVSGTFKDGTRCSSLDVKEEFWVNNYSPAEKSYKPTNEYGYGSHWKPKGSSSYYEAKEKEQEWVNYAPEQENEQKEEREYVRKVKEIVRDEPRQVTSCSGLSLSSENVAVESGEEETVYFTLRNYGSEAFEIDYIESNEYSNAFVVEAMRDATKVYSGETTSIRVKVKGFRTEEIESGSAFIELKGHYESGLSCRINSQNFNVTVNGTNKNALSRVSLDNPEEIIINGNSGFLEFSVSNPSARELNIKVYSENGTVSEEFNFEPKTSGKRIVAINGLNNDDTVFFDASAGGREYLTKYTKVSHVASAPVEQEREQVVIPIEENKEEPKEEQGFWAIGFAVINENLALIGVLIVLLLIFGILTRK